MNDLDLSVNPSNFVKSLIKKYTYSDEGYNVLCNSFYDNLNRVSDISYENGFDDGVKNLSVAETEPGDFLKVEFILEKRVKNLGEVSERLKNHINNMKLSNSDKLDLLCHIECDLNQVSNSSFFAGYLAGKYKKLENIPEKMRNLYFK